MLSTDPTVSLLTACIEADVGMSGGSIGITTAHELIHRQNKYMRGIGVVLLIHVVMVIFVLSMCTDITNM